MSEKLRHRGPDVLPPLNMTPVNREMEEYLAKYMPNQRVLQISDYDWSKISPDKLDSDFLDYVDYVGDIELGSPSYINKHMDSATAGGATWKVNWLKHPNGWGAQETMHGELLAEYRIRAGRITRSEMEERKRKIREIPFTIGEGYNPIKSDAFGFFQEAVTGPSYDMVRKPSASDPVLHQVLGDIGKQEHFHEPVFFKAVRSILKHNPGREGDVVKTLGDFIMPGHEIVPSEVQQQLKLWTRKYGYPVRTVLNRISNHLIEIIGYKGAGEALRLYAKNHDTGRLAKTIIALAEPLPDALFARATVIYIKNFTPKTMSA